MSRTVVRTGPISRTRMSAASAAGAPARETNAARNRSALRHMLHPCGTWLGVDGLRCRSTKSFEKVIPDAQRIGHDGERGIHRAARREEAAVDDIKVIEFVGFAIRVQCRRLRVFAKSDGAVLVRDSCKRDTFANEEVAAEDPLMAGVAVHLAILMVEQILKLGFQALVAF